MNTLAKNGSYSNYTHWCISFLVLIGMFFALLCTFVDMLCCHEKKTTAEYSRKCEGSLACSECVTRWLSVISSTKLSMVDTRFLHWLSLILKVMIIINFYKNSYLLIFNNLIFLMHLDSCVESGKLEYIYRCSGNKRLKWALDKTNIHQCCEFWWMCTAMS